MRNVRKSINRELKCDWFNCSELAVVRVPRANAKFCEPHYLINVLRFGSELGAIVLNRAGEPLTKKDES